MIQKKYLDFINEQAVNKIKKERFLNALSDINNYKNVSKLLTELILELKGNVTNLDNIIFDDFEINNNKIYTSFIFDELKNSNINELLTQIKSILRNTKNTDLYQKYFNIVFPNQEKTSFQVEIEIEKNNLNRIHVPVGLPYILKGLGLGKKIYMELIDNLTHLSTNGLDRNMDVLFVWDSLSNSSDVYTFVRNQSIICISIKNDFNDIEKLLTSFFNGLTDEYIILDDDFLEKYNNEILKSKNLSEYHNYSITFPN